MSGFWGWFQPANNDTGQRFGIEVLSSQNPAPPVPRDHSPSLGSLPMTVVADAGCTLAFHGELLGLNDLRQQLGVASEVPQAALVLAAWRRWSSEFVSHLDGVFALVLHANDELLLYRDLSGMQNLFWGRSHAGALAFATGLNALLQQARLPRRIERHSLHEYLRFLDIAAPNTFFEGVSALEAGHLLRLSTNGAEMFGPAKTVETIDAPVTDFAGAVDSLDELLRHGVETRLRNSVRPAAFLSGGIDSSLLCALAHGHRADAVALTVGFDGARYDESALAARIAAHLGMKHQVLRYEHAHYLRAFERLSKNLDQPMADPATPATVLAFNHCREHFDAVLDGTGADEAAGAMPPRHVRLAVGYASLLPGALRRGLVRGMRAVPGIADYSSILDFEHPADTMIRWRGFTRTEIEQLCNEPVSFEHTRFYRTFARYPRGAHFERCSALLDAMPSDRLSQSASITGMNVRYPFFDARTNCFLRQLRTDWRYLPGQPKRILRALLARYVPTQIWDLPKHGFDFPLQQFLAAGDYALVRRYLVNGTWLARGLLRPDEVRRYARQFMAGDQRLMFRAWALMVLGAWLEKHDELH